MKTEIKFDDIIFNFFKQICDEKDDIKCVKLRKNWIHAMETNIANIEVNLDEDDLIKHKEGIQKNKEHLNSLRKTQGTLWDERFFWSTFGFFEFVILVFRSFWNFRMMDRLNE